MMRLELPEAKCREISFSCEFTGSEDVDSHIKLLTKETQLVRPEDQDLETALYGSIYEVDDITIAVAGNLLRDEGDSHTSYWFVIKYLVGDSDLPPPPEEWKPVTDLLQLLSGLLDEVMIECEATFVHELGDGVRSRVALPSPLLLADQSSTPNLTHIESVVLSRREQDTSTHTVEVIPIEDGSSILHVVNFTLSSTLTWGSVRQMFELAGLLSMSLIEQDSV